MIADGTRTIASFEYGARLGMIVGVLTGAAFGLAATVLFYEVRKAPTEVACQLQPVPPARVSDKELLTYWFGPEDKAALRRRVCGRA